MENKIFYTNVGNVNEWEGLGKPVGHIVKARFVALYKRRIKSKKSRQILKKALDSQLLQEQSE